jgi:phospholipid/cholesterol/gamma-HCH transport system ATP-binding protein
MKKPEPIIEIKNLKFKIDKKWIHNSLNLSIEKGEIIGIVGTSGSGKTTLMREILMLLKPFSGSICVYGEEVTHASPEELLKIQKIWGVLFQKNALFSSLTVLENIEFPLRKKTSLSDDMIKELALQRLLSVGLSMDAATKYPSELSGGMEKRAALARALVLDPKILFLDEPTTGLDPESAAELDDLILNLQAMMGLTIIIITHDLDTLWKVTNRVAFLNEGKVICVDPIKKITKNPDPLIQNFFNGPRGRASKTTHER